MSADRRAVTLKPPPAPLGSGLTSLSACAETVGPDGCHPPTPLNCLALLLTHSGRAESHAGEVTFTHRPRRLVAVADGTIYEELLPVGARWHLSYLLLRGPWCDALNRALRKRPGAVLVVDDAPAHQRALLCDTVETVLAQPREWAWQTMAGIATLFGDLLALSADADSPLTARVGRLIDHEPGRTWAIAELASRLDLTSATFARQFTVEAGESPSAWIRRRRIDHARRLLSQSLDVADVAERLGFANPYHFSRVFKSVTGLPPSHVRRAAVATSLHAHAAATND